MLYEHVDKQAIIEEYAEACASPHEYQKAKWGSPDGMINRFRLGLSVINWANVDRWLDIGCGTGTFFSTAEQHGHHFDELVGVDITEQMLVEARGKRYLSSVKFLRSDLEVLSSQSDVFDLVTLVGVLQQCGAPPNRAIPACANMVKPDGQLFLTTKNLAWEQFTSGSLKPEPSHSWFMPDELAEIMECNQLEIVQSGGFAPREGRQVPMNESHTIYFLVRKKV